MSHAPGHQSLRRSRAAAVGVSLFAAALLVPASVAAQSLPETVTVSWLLPVAPQVKLDVEDASIGNFSSIFPQVYVAQVEGASLGNEALLPQCGYVQEDVYLLNSQDDVALLASLEANGLTESNGKAGDHTIVQHWMFEFAGDCSTPSPSESASPTDTATPTPTDTATPTPTDTATHPPTDTATPTPTDTAPPTGSAEPSSGTPTPTGSAEASSGTPGVTPPATSTDGSNGGSGNGALLLVLALMAIGTTGVLVLAPSPVNRRRR